MSPTCRPAETWCECSIEVDGAESAPSARIISLGADNTEEDCTTETVVQVAAGDHTVDFEYADVDAGTTVGASSLQVLFVPFGATGRCPRPSRLGRTRTSGGGWDRCSGRRPDFCSAGRTRCALIG